MNLKSAGTVRILMASTVAHDSMFKSATALYNNKKLERLSEYCHWIFKQQRSSEYVVMLAKRNLQVYK
jgi:hypothetical protein